MPIYSDSVNAISWIKQKKCKTKLPREPKTEELFKLIERAEKWLRENTYTTKILNGKPSSGEKYLLISEENKPSFSFPLFIKVYKTRTDTRFRQ